MATTQAVRTIGPVTLTATYDTGTLFVQSLSIALAAGSSAVLKIGKIAGGSSDASFYTGTLVAGTPQPLPLPGNTYSVVNVPVNVPGIGGQTHLTNNLQVSETFAEDGVTVLGTSVWLWI